MIDAAIEQVEKTSYGHRMVIYRRGRLHRPAGLETLLRWPCLAVEHQQLRCNQTSFKNHVLSRSTYVLARCTMVLRSLIFDIRAKEQLWPPGIDQACSRHGSVTELEFVESVELTPCPLTFHRPEIIIHARNRENLPMRKAMWI